MARRLQHLDEEDRELWRRVTETVRPLDKHPAAPPAKEAEAKSKPTNNKTNPAKEPAEAVAPKPAPPPAAPSLNPIDKKLTRRIARGSRGVDAKLDLHGLNQREAHARLLFFLQTARARGHRLVLVVTGKGRSDGTAEWWEEGTRGVLRRAVPEWLATPPFRAMVVGYERAHVHKGGDGALYVQLRRADKPGPGEAT